MGKKWIWLLAGALGVVLFVRLKLAPAPVVLSVAQTTNVVAEVMGTGTLEARIKTTLSPRVQERLAEVLVDQGDFVKGGQLLARLDDGELKRQVDVAEATVASVKATAERVRVDERRAEAVEQQARQDHTRIADLARTQVNSQAALDKAIEQLRVAESDLQRARAATIEAGQQVITAEKNLDHQRERLSFTRILSPYDGLITRRDRDPGGVVVPGSSILQLISTNELWISAWVDETASTGLRAGQPARVVFRSDRTHSYPGEVARLGRETDRETREFLVDVKLKALPPNWTVGQRAEVFIETERKTQTLAVPDRFLHWRERTPGVFAADGGRCVWREVTVGSRGQGWVEVIQGLAVGDTVVAPANSQQPLLRDGQRVRVQ